MVECRTRDPDVPSSNPSLGKKKISHRSNQNNTSTNLSAPVLNTWNCQRWKQEITMVQWESTGLDIQRSPVQTLVSLYPRVKYLKMSEVKTRSWHGAVMECRTRDPDVPSSNPSVGKKKIFHRSNQNNTTTNPSTPELNSWNCQRWKQDITMVQW